MNLVHEYKSCEDQVKALQARMAKIQEDPNFAKERKFEQSLRDLMAENGKSLRDIIAILDPDAALTRAKPQQSDTRQQRKPRQVKVYKNPHNDEIIETKGGNHRGLKAWKEEYGSDVVEGWLQK